jgi:predicted RNA binding protein YcfA (HicA-like mRNA interferase family)
MGDSNFNRRQCIRALIRLGFVLANKRHGQHDKFLAPSPHNSLFIMVPRHKNLNCQHAILRELKKIGGEEMEKKFLENL